MINLGKSYTWIFVFIAMLNSVVLSAEVNSYPLTPPPNRTAIGPGLGLETGLIGLHYSHWLTEPAIIVNFGFIFIFIFHNNQLTFASHYS